ncbi:MAG: YihY/virulence factor BrkB family protein [Cyanophyceae cyanobacterium]
MNSRQLWRLLKQSFQEWQSDRASLLAAALAYYTALAIAPILILVIAIAGFFLGQYSVQGEVFRQLQLRIGDQGAESIQLMLNHAGNHPSGTTATIVSLILLFVSASGVFNQLRESLNLIWGVKVTPKFDLKRFVKKRILSFSMIPVIGFLLLISLAMSAILSGLSEVLFGSTRDWLPLLKFLNFLISSTVTTLLFALVYKVLPDVKVDWSDVWTGAVVTTLLFNIGEWAIGKYLANGGVSSIYGAAGSFVVLLLWIYYSAQIVLFGAEFTQVYANQYGSKIRAKFSAKVSSH